MSPTLIHGGQQTSISPQFLWARIRGYISRGFWLRPSHKPSKQSRRAAVISQLKWGRIGFQAQSRGPFYMTDLQDGSWLPPKSHHPRGRQQEHSGCKLVSLYLISEVTAHHLRKWATKPPHIQGEGSDCTQPEYLDKAITGDHLSNWVNRKIF